MGQGYSIGNPVTDEDADINERIPYAHRVALISDKQFEVLLLSICIFKLVLEYFFFLCLIFHILNNDFSEQESAVTESMRIQIHITLNVHLLFIVSIRYKLLMIYSWHMSIDFDVLDNGDGLLIKCSASSLSTMVIF